MNTIYVFPDAPNPQRDCAYFAVGEDGAVLATHISSCEGFGKLDLGIGNDSCHHHKAYKEKYPDGYQLEYVPDWTTHGALLNFAKGVRRSSPPRAADPTRKDQHTPGPWKDRSIKFSGGWRCVVTLPNGRCIDIADPRDRATDEEDAANARLIAEAPDTKAERDRFREALQELRKRIDRGSGRHGNWGISDFVDQVLGDAGAPKCAACRSVVQVDGNSLCDSCREELAGGPA